MRRLKFDSCSDVPRTVPKTSSSGANARLALRALEVTTRVRALDAEHPSIAIEVAPGKGSGFAEPQAGPEGDVEEIDVKEIRFILQRIDRRETDERRPDSVRVLAGDLLADEVLSRRQVGAGRRVRDELPLTHCVGEHPSQRRHD